MTTDQTPVHDLGRNAPGSGEQPAPEPNADRAAQLEQERDEMKALALRARADYDNLKRRTDEERLSVARNASHGVVARLLPSIDDLERAVGDLPPGAPLGWAEGVRLVLRNIHAFVAAQGVVRIDPAPGDPFNPAEHEAAAHLPSADQPPGSVLSTIRSGYRGGPDRVLRPAQVVVAREPEANTGEAGTDHGAATNHSTSQPVNPGEKELTSNG